MRTPWTQWAANRWTRRFGRPALEPEVTPEPLGGLPLPVDHDRIATCLRGRGYSFVVDADGDLTGSWNTHQFWFLLLGDDADVVQVRGRWARTLTLRQRRPALLALNDWNRERIWPKSYLREEDGRIAVYAEVSVDLESGANDDQLDQIITCGLGTGVQLFKALDNQVPPAED
ncbi:MAG: YbjN domain-containing protein [Micrococcales bacterium]|nr:YbjN domain-containing protein [Micrococcales bacterium]MCL2666599.1 YbjN domain-containing protein [Micrococcales bacterium]